MTISTPAEGGAAPGIVALDASGVHVSALDYALEGRPSTDTKRRRTLLFESLR
jgi:hypothetical protein